MSWPTILIFIVLLALSAFFSWTEIALMSLPKHKIESFLKQWLSWSKALKYIKEKSDKLLITILIWNNLVNTFTAAFATTIAMWIAKNSWLWLDQSTAIAIATWIVTLLLLLFWEIAPKSFAIKNSEKISLSVAWIYKTLMFLLYPLVIIIEFITKLFTWKNKENQVSEEEIEAFIDMWKESWTLEKEEHKHLKNILEFDEISVDEIMTPRVKFDKLSDDTTIEDSINYILTHTHSRIPVYHEDIDKIIWIINIRTLLEELNNWNKNKKLKDIKLFKAIKVPLNKPIDELLKTFQKNHHQMAIVIDEYGGVDWLITLEDIIEEVFWEIQDETDKEENNIQKISNNEYVVSSILPFEEVLELFNLTEKDLDIEENKAYDGETLSYVITNILERFPKQWENLEIILKDNKKIQLKVLKIKDGTIGNIHILVEKKD